MGSGTTRRQGRTRIRSFVTALQILILLGMSASLGAGIALFISLSSVIPQINNVEAPEATIIYSSDRQILARMYRENRTNVPLKAIPENLRRATVAIEDKRFYSHSGLDMKGIARSIWANVRGHRLSQGGSTITQQLARNVYLTRKKTVQRKVQEAVLAILLERHFSKDRILGLYLNRVYYGSGAFGVQAASKVYFGKDVKELNLSQCAMLAGMPQKPSGYSPHEDMEAARGRRNVVLNSMLALGYISAHDCHKAQNQGLRIVPRASGRQTYKAPHFVDYVIKQLRDRYGDDVLFSGGLRVYTTLNYEMQEIAEKALRQGVHRFERSKRVTEGCFVAIEAGSGYIRAMVGSVDPSSQFNRCTQGLGQQPGSSFKAFVYTAAFAEGGMKPGDRISNERLSLPGGNGRTWSPKNYDSHYGGHPTIKSAVAKSINLVAIRVADKVGMDKVIQYAQLMGIKSTIQPYLSSAIGASDVYPLEMAGAYGTFANDGAFVEPCAIVRVNNAREEVVEDFQPQATPVISEKVNAMIDECLRAVVTSGTGRPAGVVRDARGKTGTTNEDRDAWFIGYVPHKMVGVCWVGNDDNSPMRGAYGSVVCAPVWREFMLKSLPILERIQKGKEAAAKPKKEDKPAEQAKPDEVKNQDEPEPRQRDESDVTQTDETDMTDYAICDDTGMLATENCPSHIKRFASGKAPKSYCSTHRRASVSAPRERPAETPSPAQEVTMVTVPMCPESGMLAGPGCPHRTRKKVALDKVPTQVCNQHNSTGR